MRAGALAAFCVLAAAAPAAAEDAEVFVESLQLAVEEGRHWDAYQLSRSAVEKAPDDPEVRYLAASAALTLSYLDEAEAHVVAGLRAGDDANLLGYGAMVAMSRGDLDEARRRITRALELEPEQPDAMSARDVLDMRDRGRRRLRGEEAPLDPATPAGYVDRFLERCAAGASAKELASFVDSSFAGAMGPGAARVQIEGFIQGAQESARRGSGYVGWIVEPTDDTHVRAWLPADKRITRAELEQLVAALDTPMRDLADPTLVAVIESVPPGERSALLDRIAEERHHNVQEVVFEVTRAGDRFAIADAIVNGQSLRASIGAFAAQAADEREEKSAAYRLGQLLGPILLAGLIWAIVRAFSRRRRR